MYNIYITKINKKNQDKLFTYLFHLSEKVCFTTLHDYKLSEELYDSMIDEYRSRCKQKHHDMNELYKENDPILRKLMRKYHLKDEDDFKEFNDNNYEAEMGLIKQMEKLCATLFSKTEVTDYKEVFKEISPYYENVETHFFDQIKTSIFPLDIVTYNKGNEILNALLAMRDLSSFVFLDDVSKISYMNAGFINKEDYIFAAVEQESKMISVELEDTEYEAFRKLKIRHEKEHFDYEK